MSDSISKLVSKRIMVTGAGGFLAEALARQIAFCSARFLPLYHSHVDLTQAGATDHIIRSQCPDYVIHAAGYNGGIAFNEANAADIFYKNTMMGLNVIHACNQANVRKMISVVASCAYPDITEEFLSPDQFLTGQPHPSVACHGYAKRNLQLASKFYHKQHGLNAVCACITTIYGPGDSFDLKQTKVTAALVRRFCDAVHKKEKEVELWGSGNQRRQLIYVDDAAQLLLLALANYENHDVPINIATGEDISLLQLAETIAELSGFDGEIVWNTTYPDGQYRKQLAYWDIASMAAESENWFPITRLEDGLRNTIRFYRENYLKCEN